MDRSLPPPSFEALFEAHFDYVVLLIRLAGVPKAETEDLAQSVFLALFIAMEQGRYDPSMDAKPWLKATTYRIARDHMQRLSNQERPAPEEVVFDQKDEAMNSEQRVALNQQWNMMLDLFLAVEPERRRILVMHDIEEMTTTQIAEELSLSPNTVSTRLRLAREEFEAALRRKRAEERRTLREVGAVLLPVDAGAILRMAHALPVPEAPAEMRSRVRASLKRVTAALEPTLPRGSLPPWRPAAPRPAQLSLPSSLPVKLLQVKTAGLLVITSAFSAGVTAATLANRDQPLSTPASNISHSSTPASTPANASSAAPIPSAQGGSSATAMPQACVTSPTGNPGTPIDADAAERLLIQRARAALESTKPNPAEALFLLRRYEEIYRGSNRFMKERQEIKQDALALQRSARGRKHPQ